jgi:hypothetical protein
MSVRQVAIVGGLAPGPGGIRPSGGLGWWGELIDCKQPHERLANEGPGHPEGYPRPRKVPRANRKLSNTPCIEDYQYDEDHEDYP